LTYLAEGEFSEGGLGTLCPSKKRLGLLLYATHKVLYHVPVLDLFLQVSHV
jgi:hypothetical protein